MRSRPTPGVLISPRTRARWPIGPSPGSVATVRNQSIRLPWNRAKTAGLGYPDRRARPTILGGMVLNTMSRIRWALLALVALAVMPSPARAAELSELVAQLGADDFGAKT